MPRETSPKASPLRQSHYKQEKQTTKRKQTTTNTHDNDSVKTTIPKKQPFSNKKNKSPKSNAERTKAKDRPNKNRTITEKNNRRRPNSEEIENNANKTDTKKLKISPNNLKVGRPRKILKLEDQKQSSEEKVEVNNSPRSKKRKLPYSDSKDLSPDKSNIGTIKTVKLKKQEQCPEKSVENASEKKSKDRKRLLSTQNVSDTKDSPPKKTEKLSARRKCDVIVDKSKLKSLPKLDLDKIDETVIDKKEVLSKNNKRTKSGDSKKVKRSPIKNTSPFKKTTKSIALSELVESPGKKRTKSPNKRCKVRKKVQQRKNIEDENIFLHNKTAEKEDASEVIKFYKTHCEYIVEGFKDDCELFICKCQSVSRLNYQKFREVWRDMDFAHLYHGRQTGAEIAEVSEELIHVAKSYMIAKDRHFEVNVTGLFLVYTLLHFQPYKNFAPLKLVPEDIPAIKALESEARMQRRHDVLYILGCVLRQGPCQFHVTERERALDHYLRKYFDGTVQVSDANTQPVGALGNNLEVLSILKTLSTLDRKYSEAKQKLQQYSGSDRSLNYSQFTAEELHQSILHIVPKYLSETVNMTSPTKVQSYEEERQSTMRTLKDKAMTNTVKPIRHLTGVVERKKQSLTPPTPTTGNKSATSVSDKRNEIIEDDADSTSQEWSPKILRKLFKMKSNIKNDRKQLCPKKITPDSSPKTLSEMEKTAPKSGRKIKHDVKIDLSADSDQFDDDTKYGSDDDNSPEKAAIGESLPLIDTSTAENNDDANMSPELKSHRNIRVTTLPLEIQGAENHEIEVEIMDYYNEENDGQTRVNTNSEIKILSIEDITPMTIKSKQNIVNSVNFVNESKKLEEHIEEDTESESKYSET